MTYFLQKNYVKISISFLVGFLLPIILTTVYFLIHGAFKDFLEAALFQNINYVGGGNKVLLSQSPFLLHLILLAIFVIIIFNLRQRFSKPTVFILLWFGFSLFNTFFSPRHYTHYLLVLFPSLLLLFQLIFWDKKSQKLSIVLFALGVVLVFGNFRLYNNNLNYYQNFLSFIIGVRDVESYRRFFDRQTPIDYRLAQFINSKTSDKDSIFIWGNNAQVYKMTNKLPPGKYSVAYHISYYKDGVSNILQALNKTHPKFIIIMPKQTTPPFSLMNYTERINLDDVLIYERIF